MIIYYDLKDPRVNLLSPYTRVRSITIKKDLSVLSSAFAGTFILTNLF